MKCVICKEKIIEEKERWVRLTDFNRGKEVGEVLYHLECWKDRFNISNSMRKQKMYDQAQNAIGGIMEKIREIVPQKEPVYEIR